MSNVRLLSAFLVACSVAILSASCSDEVHDLPGLSDAINFRHFSGYLKGENPDNLLHYWFVESQNDPKNDPLVLWLNGGPGCSSIGGLLGENGPFRIQTDGRTLKINPYSWNLKANVIYLEAPVGVGFSFNTKTDIVPTNDNKTAHDNYAALKEFFKRFPQYQKNEFFITGESYGGVYVPTLTKLVLDGSFVINLQGFAIGNGLLDFNRNLISVAFYYYGHGFIDEKNFRMVVENCCQGSFDMTKCKMNSMCSTILADVGKLIGPGNPYNVYQKCPASLTSFLDTEELSSSQLIRSKLVVSMSTCIPDKTYAEYMNQKSVRQALHIDSRVGLWEFCNPIPYKMQNLKMENFISALVKRTRGLIYNGDFDTVCNYLGDEWFASDLGLEVVNPKRPYLQDNLTAGYKTVYKNLTFITVKGAGHMVPSDQPSTILRVIQAFIKNEDF